MCNNEMELKLEEKGATSALLSWDSVADGAVYTLDLLDDKSNTLKSVETQETSLAFQDLTSSTNYVFKLFAEVPPEYEYFTNIRIDHYADTYLALIEVWPFDIGGSILPSELFTISSTGTHSTGYSKNAMNGNTSTNNSTNGALLLPKSNLGGNTPNVYWEAQCSPVQLSGIRLYTTTQYNFASDSTLTMTKSNGDTVQYSLGGEHNLGSFTYIQQIAFPKA